MTQPYIVKYPFFEAAKDAITDYDMLEALQSPAVLDRAAERIVRGINKSYNRPLDGDGVPQTITDLDVELQSYPAARILVSLIGDYRIVNRYARSEAKTAITSMKADFKTEDLSKQFPHRGKRVVTEDEVFAEYGLDIEETSLAAEFDRTYVANYLETASPAERQSFAVEVFGFAPADDAVSHSTLAALDPSELYDHLHTAAQTAAVGAWYSMPIDSYLPTTVSLSDNRWRLTNRGVHDGCVIIPRDDLMVFLEETIYLSIVENLPHDVEGPIAELLAERVDAIREGINDDHFSYEIDRIEPGLYPPVIKQMMKDFPNQLKHEERVTLAAFFLHIGMTVNEVLETLGVINTPGEDPTKYQVKHISTGGSDGEPYTPANYATIESWGYEWEKDALEASVQNPLTYYKIKLKDTDDTPRDGEETPEDGDDGNETDEGDQTGTENETADEETAESE